MTILRSCIIEQPEYQWNYQLRHEKDVTAQMEAVIALDKFPTISTRNALCDIIENEQVYIHVRCKAAHCLTKVCNCRNNYHNNNYNMFVHSDYRLQMQW
jgi:transcription initiation factor TFIID subunit 2